MLGDIRTVELPRPGIRRFLRRVAGARDADDAAQQGAAGRGSVRPEDDRRHLDEGGGVIALCYSVNLLA